MSSTLLAGKYRMERVLGQGGMGVVVGAMHTLLNQRIAIKLLLPEALSNPETRARFMREAHATARIQSEHVARVTDVGVVDAGALPAQAELGIPLAVGAPYIVMEYLEGQDLAGVLRATGPLPIVDVVSYLAQAIEAIAEAHTYGIIHRDIKPSNLFLTRRPDGTPLVKVLDFGISKALPQNGMDAQMTTTSAVLGSPMYMAPEQMIASREVDGRTDVWSLGVVMYQLLTGRGPFNGTTMTELCARILQEPHSPIRATRPDVPPELEAVVARCLEKDRVRRFASVADLAEAIAPFGGQAAALSAERARRLIPRTERASHLPQQQTDPYAMGIGATAIAGAAPYAATNPSWAHTRNRSSSSSNLWIVLVASLAGVVACAAVVILIIASRGHTEVNITSPPTAVAEPPVPTATATQPVPTDTATLAPLHVSDTKPPVQTGQSTHHPPATVTTNHPPGPYNPPPQTTATQPRPDIF